jgi:hypothetical protein
LDFDFGLNNKNVSFRKNAIDVDNILNYNQENNSKNFLLVLLLQIIKHIVLDLIIMEQLEIGLI